MTRRYLAFAAICLAAIAAVLLYIALARPHVGGSRDGSRTTASASGIPTRSIDAVPAGPTLLFRHAGPGPLFGRLAIVSLPANGGDLDPQAIAGEPRAIGPLSCERVHYAAGAGVCMLADETRLPVRYEAYVFDAAFTRKWTLALTGPPIRARVSPDGRRAALTVFETGHSYADASFSTRTTLLDMKTGRELANLEDFTVRKDGATFKEVDFNFWGVTFARDGDTFYATLKTGSHRYLVRGSVDARAVTVVRDDVECPSLSPDERLIVFKKPMTREVGWRLYVLDVATGAERPLSQIRRSVDDQVDWLDPRHIVFHDSASEGTGIWMLSTDDSSPPVLLLASAYSPAVQR